MKSLNSPNISVGGLEPVTVVYIEVSNIEKFNVGCEVSKDSGSKILKEGEKVSSIREAMAKAKNKSSCREIYF